MSGASKADLERVRDLLRSDEKEKRAEALDLCASIGSADAVPEVAAALAENRLEGALRLRALRWMELLGYARPLDDIRADGWLEQLGTGVGGFDELCDIMGRPFVGFATMIGVQIATLDVRADDMEKSDVGFTLGDARMEHLPLREFKRRVVSAITGDVPSDKGVALPLDREKTIELLGSRHVLLAALFDWTLEWIFVGGPSAGPKDARVDLFLQGRPATVTAAEMASMLRVEVEAEWQRYLDPLAGVSAEMVGRARDLLRLDPVRVIDLLGPLFRFVLKFGRSAARPALDPALLPVLCEGIVLVAKAHMASSPEHVRYGEEVIRLGVQTFPGVPGAERLHLALGELLVRTGRHAEALGHLRRAATLGIPRDAVEPLLVDAFYHCGQLVAAAAIWAGLRARLPDAVQRVGSPLVASLESQAAVALRAAGEAGVS